MSLTTYIGPIVLYSGGQNNLFSSLTSKKKMDITYVIHKVVIQGGGVK